jgi:hypothetical protein
LASNEEYGIEIRFSWLGTQKFIKTSEKTQFINVPNEGDSHGTRERYRLDGDSLLCVGRLKRVG